MRIKGNKVGIVGAGQVGATSAYTLLISGLVSELVLVDLNEKKSSGEVLDLSHGIPLCPPAEIGYGGYDRLAGSDIVVLTAGVGQQPGETRMDLVRRNIEVFRQIVPEVVRYAPDAILLVVTNPVDILTYETLQISGLPASRVIGSGTVLDTSRLKQLLSKHTGVDPRSIHTFVLGEHGDTELAAWSRTTIAGQSIDEFCAGCCACGGSLAAEIKAQFDAEVRNVAYTIIERKGATYYAVALAVRRIVEAILRDESSILTVSSLLNGQYDLEDVCLSLPSIVSARGIERVVSIGLDTEETQLLRKSGAALKQILSEL